MLASEGLRINVVSTSLVEETDSLAMSDSIVELSAPAAIDVVDGSSSASVLIVDSSEGPGSVSLFGVVASESARVEEVSVSPTGEEILADAEVSDGSASVVSSADAVAEISIPDGRDEESVSCEGETNKVEDSAEMVSTLLTEISSAVLPLDVSGVSNVAVSTEVSEVLPEASETVLALSKAMLSDIAISDETLPGRVVISTNPSVELSGSLVVELLISDESLLETVSDVALSLRSSVVLQEVLSVELCDETSPVLSGVVETSMELC